MENEWLKEALFRPGELLQGPEIRALIFLPMEGAPEPADVQMLERMLEAMSFSQGAWRYLYHEGHPDWKLVEEQNTTILFFASPKSGLRSAELKKENEHSWFSLPPLQEIRADQVLKRLVWDLIKP
jgi:hypothetical protein